MLQDVCYSTYENISHQIMIVNCLVLFVEFVFFSVQLAKLLSEINWNATSNIVFNYNIGTKLIILIFIFNL